MHDSGLPRPRLRLLVAPLAGALVLCAGGGPLAWGAHVDGAGVTMNAPPYPGTVFLRIEEDPAHVEPFRLHSDLPPVVTLTIGGRKIIQDSTKWQDVRSPIPFFDTTKHSAGVLMHWGLSEAYRYFAEEYGRTGLKNESESLTGFVITEDNFIGCSHEYQPPPLNPFEKHSINEFITCGTRWEGQYTFVPMIDSIGHEFTHGIIYHTSQLPSTGEGGALNESFGDIFGLMLKFKVYPPGVSNWNFAEIGLLYPDIYPWPVMRHPPDPHMVSNPATYGSDVVNGKELWKDPADLSSDDGGVHFNCDVQNHWFFLLAEGGAGTNAKGWPYKVQGIGKQSAAYIAFRNMTEKLMNIPHNFHGAREGALASVTDLCGFYSQEHVSTWDAWYAVGVGDPNPYPYSTYRSPPYAPAGAAQSPMVDPWTAKLVWPTDKEQTLMAVEVSTDPTFTTGVLSLPPVLPEPDPAGIVDYIGRTKLPLAPSTTYFWRVRWANSPWALAQKMDCWRPTSTFKTEPKKGETFAPHDIGEPWYPWQVHFQWKAVPGAVKHRIEVVDDDSGAVVATAEAEGINTFLDLPPKDANLRWRVQPLGPDGPDGKPLEGEWSDWEPFATEKPPLEILPPTPDDGEKVYPWPVTLKWSPVMYAGSYSVLFTYDNGKTYSEPVPEGQTEIELWMDAEHPLESYSFQIRAASHNPGNGKDLLSDPRSFSINAEATTPEALTPSPSCIVHGKDVTLAWKPVTNASKYIGTVERQGAPVVPISTTGTSVTLPWSDFWQKPSSSYTWSVQAAVLLDPAAPNVFLFGYPMSYQNTLDIAPATPALLWPPNKTLVEADSSDPFKFTLEWAMPYFQDTNATVEVHWGRAVATSSTKSTRPSPMRRTT